MSRRRASTRAAASACGRSSAASFAEGATLLLTTQYLEEADELADPIAVVDHGHIIAHGTATSSSRSVGGERIEVIVRSIRRPRARQGAAATDSASSTQIDEESRRSRCPRNEGVQQLIRVGRGLDEAGIAIDDIGLRRPTLDDVFLVLTGHAAPKASEDGKADPPASRAGTSRSDAS